MYTVSSLFAGIGGICQGFINQGFKVVWANEIDKNACKTYRSNFKHTLYEEDINLLINQASEGCIKLENTDVLTGGFPCQAFSIAGYRKGFNDDRGNLFFKILDIVDIIRPKVIFLENVKNLRSHDKGRTIKIIRDNLEDLEYSYNDYVLNTMEYGNIPQNRERIYIIAFDKRRLKHSGDKDLNKELDELIKPKPVELMKKLSDILDKQKQEDYFYYKEGHRYYSKLSAEVTNPKTVYQWRRVYIRENQSNVCPTLTANMGTGGHNVPIIKDNYGIRKLTPRECARLQGFSDNFILPNDMARSHLYKQIGNSVSIPVIQLLAGKIKNVLDSHIL